MSTTALALATIGLSTLAAAQIPILGGGYKDAIAIPVDDPATRAIAGALFRPAGAGPFPAVIYMGTCAEMNSGEERFAHSAVRDRLLAKGFAMLVIDPYWPRQEWQGVLRPAERGWRDRCAGRQGHLRCARRPQGEA